MTANEKFAPLCLVILLALPAGCASADLDAVVRDELGVSADEFGLWVATEEVYR